MKKAIVFVALLLVVLLISSCSSSGSKKSASNSVNKSRFVKTDDEQIKDVITKYLKAQSNIDYKTVKGTEGTEYMTKRYSEYWFNNNNDDQVKRAVVKGAYIIRFGQLEWKRLDKKETSAEAEIILTGIVISKKKKTAYEVFKDYYVIGLIKESNEWRIDWSDTR